MDTRKHDLYELKQFKPKNAFERKLKDRAMTNIVRQNTPKIENLRRNLIKAVRGNSHRAINYYNNELLKRKNER